MASGDFDSLKLCMPWKQALLQALPTAAIFALIPGRGDPLIYVSVGCGMWAALATVLASLPVGATGPKGLRVGSIDLPWPQISEPTLDGKRLRVTGPGGMHFHLTAVVFSNPEFVCCVLTNAPEGHPLREFLRSRQASTEGDQQRDAE